MTAWRVNHRRRPQRRRLAHRSRSTSRPRETREEARQRKYRYLYQVRTARGDIISQVGVNVIVQMPINLKFIWFVFFLSLLLYGQTRTMFLHYKNASNPVEILHPNNQRKAVHMNGIPSTVIGHILQTFLIQMRTKWILFKSVEINVILPIFLFFLCCLSKASLVHASHILKFWPQIVFVNLYFNQQEKREKKCTLFKMRMIKIERACMYVRDWAT